MEIESVWAGKGTAERAVLRSLRLVTVHMI
jgi:hypothetical protein